jgi:hypothetical protein
MRSQCCLCICESPPQSTSECLNQSLGNVVSISWHLNGVLRKSLPSVCVYVCVARQRLGKNVTAATNTHTIEELLDVSFYMRTVSYQRRAGEQFSPELIILCSHLQLGFSNGRFPRRSRRKLCRSMFVSSSMSDACHALLIMLHFTSLTISGEGCKL